MTIELTILLQETQIKGMSTGHWIAVAAIVVPVFISIIVGLGILIFRSGTIVQGIQTINKTIEPVPEIAARVEVLWSNQTTVSRSPMQLNEVGEKVLKQSNIRELTQKYYDDILVKIKDLNPPNPYQAQQILIDVVNAYKNVDEYKNKLETGAFNAGMDVDTVLLVGAIDIRDRIIKDIGFQIDDIDKHDPSIQSKADS